MMSVPVLTPEPMIVDTAERLFARIADAAGESGGTAGAPFDASAWREIESAGLASAWVDEALGGGGAGVVDALAVARAAGRHALALPVVETLLASRALAAAGIALPGGALALALDLDSADPEVTDAAGGPGFAGNGTLSGRFERVAGAGCAGHIVVVARGAGGWQVGLVDPAQAGCEPLTGLSGEPRDTLHLDEVRPLQAEPAGNTLDGCGLLALAALLRSVQMAGALDAVLALTLDYARQREQFGRPISRFQAVQHELAKLAGECAAASAAAGAGGSALARFGMQDERTWRACAVAKIRVGEAAGAGAAMAHQVHGAMGFSREYVLQRFTRRLWTWRDDFGPEAWWAARLGRRVAAAGAAALWPSLTDA